MIDIKSEVSSLDPVTFTIIRNRLVSIANEMQTNIFRTGYSTAVRESQDASCAVLDTDGNVVGELIVLPLHIGAFPECVRALKERYDIASLRPGDAFISNDPYVCGVPHTSDMAVLTPVFYKDELLAFCANIAHKTDIGGIGPGGGSAQAREILHEGTLFPMVRIMREGTMVAEIESIVRANSRTPEQVLGDIRGQIGTARLGERRLAELCDKYGRDAVRQSFTETVIKTEQRLRSVIENWPNGVYKGESFMDSDGCDFDQRVRIAVNVTIDRSHISFDFSESSPQTRGPINLRPPMVRAACYFALIALADTELPNNAGVARVADVRCLRGSVLDPVYPAPLNNYIPTATAVIEAVLMALAEVVLERAIASPGGDGGIYLRGKGADGKSFVLYEIQGSAYGARSTKDGVSGVGVYVSNCRITPIEIVESEFPLRIERFELVRDSGGPGRLRGGLSYRRQFRVLAPEGKFSLRGGKHVVEPKGLRDGLPGRHGRCEINPGGQNPVSLPSRVGEYQLAQGDVVRIEKAGAGGYDAPVARPRAAVVEDVLNGYVSVEAAVSVYGLDEETAEKLQPWIAMDVLDRPRDLEAAVAETGAPIADVLKGVNE